MAPGKTENKVYAKFWGDKRRALWYHVMVFSGMVNSHDFMSRIDLVSKNFLANFFRNCRKRNLRKNYVRKSLTNIAKIAKITNLTRIKT